MHLVLMATVAVLTSNRVSDAAPGINLSWDDCGAAGSDIKTFAPGSAGAGARRGMYFYRVECGGDVHRGRFVVLE